MDYHITELAAKIIYLANKGFSIHEIGDFLQADKDTLLSELKIWETVGLLQVLPISYDGFRLQNHLISQQYIIPKYKQHLKALWKNSVALFPENIALVSLMDGSEFTYKDCDDIIKTIGFTLQKNNIKKGDKIIICSKNHSEAILLFWACMQAGVVVVPIGMHLPAAAFTYILEQTNPVLCFTNQSVLAENKYSFGNITTVLFDEAIMQEDDNGLYFSNWLTEEEFSYEEATISHTDEAVILFTSGSTGIPKGVQLSHGNLYRSGRLITETFCWEAEDRFLAFGGLDSMSGLRNATIAPAHVGASVVIPTEASGNNLFTIVEDVAQNKVTILGCNPAMLHQLVKHKDKIGSQLKSVKTLICTGNKLSDTLRADFKNAYNLPILNYYGLTETTGICISQSMPDEQINLDTIGKPIDCIAQIVNEKGEVLPAGKEGELRIFSENLMQGYFKDNSQTALVLKNGWFYTQDLARYTADGNIELKGRKRDIVKTATEELVYLSVVQQFINSLSFVEDCFVCSFQKEHTEKIAAFIVLKKGSDSDEQVIKLEIKNAIAKNLGENKVPNKITFLPALPYSENGKLLINQLNNE